jgi:hypothetical protein
MRLTSMAAKKASDLEDMVLAGGVVVVPVAAGGVIGWVTVTGAATGLGAAVVETVRGVVRSLVALLEPFNLLRIDLNINETTRVPSLIDEYLPMLMVGRTSAYLLFILGPIKTCPYIRRATDQSARTSSADVPAGPGGERRIGAAATLAPAA